MYTHIYTMCIYIYIYQHTFTGPMLQILTSQADHFPGQPGQGYGVTVPAGAGSIDWKGLKERRDKYVPWRSFLVGRHKRECVGKTQIMEHLYNNHDNHGLYR